MRFKVQSSGVQARIILQDRSLLLICKTSDGHELDLVLILDGEIWAFEIKLTGSPGRKELDNLNRSAEMIGADKMVLISRTRKEIRGKHIVSTNLSGILRLMSEI